MLAEHLGGKQVTGGPVVYIGQKSVYPLQHPGVGLPQREQGAVEIVLFIVPVGECLQKRFALRGSRQLFGQLTDLRGADPDDRSGSTVGISLQWKVR